MAGRANAVVGGCSAGRRTGSRCRWSGRRRGAALAVVGEDRRKWPRWVAARLLGPGRRGRAGR